MSDWYYLKNRKPVPYGCTVFDNSERFFKLMTNHFGNNKIRIKYLADCWVSTIFLGLDHSFTGGKPMLFETMIFKKDSLVSMDCFRSSTHRQALKQHQAALKLVRPA